MWDFSEDDLDKFRSELQAYRDSLPLITVLDADLSHGLSDVVIEKIVSEARRISSPDDVLSFCPVRSFIVAKSVWTIMCDVLDFDSHTEEDCEYVEDDDM